MTFKLYPLNEGSELLPLTTPSSVTRKLISLSIAIKVVSKCWAPKKMESSVPLNTLLNVDLSFEGDGSLKETILPKEFVSHGIDWALASKLKIKDDIISTSIFICI